MPGRGRSGEGGGGGYLDPDGEILITGEEGSLLLDNLGNGAAATESQAPSRRGCGRLGLGLQAVAGRV